MTITELFSSVQALKPHSYTSAELLVWLNRIETRVYDELIKTHIQQDGTMIHEGVPSTPIALLPFAGFTAQTDTDTTLVVPLPFDDLYLYYLMIQIDHHNQEYDKGNNSTLLFNAAYQDFANFMNRTFLPRQITKSFVGGYNIHANSPLD